MRRFLFILVVLSLCLPLLSCRRGDEAVTAGEALQALEEASLSSQAATLVSGSIEITTDFTIGQAVEAAAQEIRDFVQSQLPCAEITLQNATLTVEYGAKSGSCTYKGQTFGGKHSVKVEKNDMGEVVVSHTWTKLTNGVLEVSGDATVTWSAANKSRHVVHTLHWTRLADGRTATGSGDRTQTPLDGSIFEGIEINGTRKWEGEKGTWDLTIDGVKVRWTAPVPEAGTYTLVTPFDDKTVTLTFERLDDSTIKVTMASGDKEFSFKVKSGGAISQE